MKNLVNKIKQLLFKWIFADKVTVLQIQIRIPDSEMIMQDEQKLKHYYFIQMERELLAKMKEKGLIIWQEETDMRNMSRTISAKIKILK